jgi:NAD(P)-dependent dehydrogenase (short-subunit alcohol dehydrogenase family)
MLVFGATGAVGQAVVAASLARGWETVGVSRGRSTASCRHDVRWVAYDPFAEPDHGPDIGDEPFDAVCWAQGANATDSIQTVDLDIHESLYRANCTYVVKTLSRLLKLGGLSLTGARLCVVSSIWQDVARGEKLSYTMTKAALGGLVRSTAVDLAADGHLMNAVLPGVLDTPMTRANLKPEQLRRVQESTLFDRLPDLQSVAALVAFLCSADNQSVTGQSVAVDLGFSHARLI